LSKLKQAKDKAEEELQKFKDEQELKFQKEMGVKASADPSSELEGVTKAEVAAVEQDYLKNKDSAMKFVLDKILDLRQ